jgi:N-acetylglucosaminyldiphosphoundecaprenol N-acetyl-beta-D-mannosaminyltransferase
MMVKRLPMSSPSEFNIDRVRDPFRPDDLTREVYGVLGIPVDVIDMAAVLCKIDVAAADKSPFLLSTPNLNFLVTSRLDPEFRESLLISDLCPADGMPIVWLARMLGAPIKERVAGSDIFEALKSARHATQRLSVFLFGGAEGVAAAACSKLNAEPGGMTCAGSFYPGFCTVDEMGTDAIIDLSPADTEKPSG